MLPVTPAGRRYGRKKPEPLPAHRMLTRLSVSLPPVVDLRAWAGAVKNQGDLGSCTGHAFASSMEWIFRRYFWAKQPVLSPLYLYANELISDGNFPADDGSDGTTGSQVSISYGCCEDSLYPDSLQQILQPTDAQNANASQYKMGAYHGLPSSQVALSVLGDPTPWPVQVGFTVYESFESDYTANTGIMTIPGSSEAQLGGHEVYLIGYDSGPTPTLRPTACPPAVLVRNSWGSDWGWEGGHFWMPLPILDRPDTDMKIIHTGHPWVVS